MTPDDASLDEGEIERLARQRQLAAGYREAARRALAFARRYRDEEGKPGGARERACVEQSLMWRRAALEAKTHSTGLRGERPGLARARLAAPAASRVDVKAG